MLFLILKIRIVEKNLVILNYKKASTKNVEATITSVIYTKNYFFSCNLNKSSPISTPFTKSLLFTCRQLSPLKLEFML